MGMETPMSLILREEQDDGVVRYGEVAPTPGFADCSLEELLPEARAWIRESANHRPIFLSALSAFRVKFGFLSMVLKGSPFCGRTRGFAQELLPCNKRKIGLGSPQEEIEEILEWMSSLPDRSKIRLDANGSLNVESLQLWLDALEGVSGLEFVEQPLPVGQFEELKLISRETSVRFALDETVVSEGGPDALRQRGWEGIALSSPFSFRIGAKPFDSLNRHPKNQSYRLFSKVHLVMKLFVCVLFHAVAGLDRSLFQGVENEFVEHQACPLIPTREHPPTESTLGILMSERYPFSPVPGLMPIMILGAKLLSQRVLGFSGRASGWRYPGKPIDLSELDLSVCRTHSSCLLIPEVHRENFSGDSLDRYPFPSCGRIAVHNRI